MQASGVLLFPGGAGEGASFSDSMEPSSLHSALAETLRERLRVIADHAWRDRDPGAHLEALRTASERLARLEATLPPGSPARLRHYLQHASYQKALAFLEDEGLGASRPGARH